MNNSITKLSITLILLLIFTSNIYSDPISKNSNNIQQNNISHIDDKINKKQAIFLKIHKSDTIHYVSYYDEIVELTISKNKLLLELDRADKVDTDRTCDLALDYSGVEFIKTQYYKTPFHDEVAKTLQNTAALYEQCHPPMAQKHLEPIIKIKEHIYTRESAEVAKAHDDLGDYYRIYMANFKEAIKEYEEAKRIREKLYGINDPRITENYERLALSLYYHGDKLNRGEQLLHDSITFRKNFLVNIDYPIYEAYMDIGIYYSMKNEYDKSISHLKMAQEAMGSKINGDTIDILSELSQVYLNKDELNNAFDYASKAHTNAIKLYKDNQHPDVVEALKTVTDISAMNSK